MMFFRASLVFACAFPDFVAGHNPHDVVSSLAASPDGWTVFAVVRRILYRSTDGGLSWDAATRGIIGIDKRADKIFRTIATSPAFLSDKTAFHTNGAGIFRTTDAGLSWRHVQTETDVDVPEGSSMLALSPTFGVDGKVIVVAKPPGSKTLPLRLMVSGSRGESFREVYSLTGDLASCKQVSLLATRDVTFVATVSGALLFSLDFGETWGINSGLGAAFTSVAELSLNKESGLWPQEATETQQEGWQIGSLLLGAKGKTFVLVYGFKTSGGSVDENFKVIKMQEIQAAAAQNPALVGTQDSTLFVLPSFGGDVSRSSDGSTWNTHRVIKDRPDLGDWKGQAAALGTGALSQFVATKSGATFIGSYCGLHKSIDGGLNWVKLDVETRRFTQLQLAKGPDASTIQFGACTYGNGCFGGLIHVEAVKKQFTKQMVSNQVQYNDERYCTMAFSPNYAEDGVILRRCMLDAKKKFSFLWRSQDNGKTWAKVRIPMVGAQFLTQDGFPVVGGIFTIVFSPNFAEDGLVYLGGVDLGIAVSEDGGNKFRTLWNANGRATKVYVSPDFKNDNSLFVLSAQLNHHKGMEFSDFSAWDGDTMHVSRDRGVTWNTHNDLMQVESLHFSPKFATDRTILGLRMLEGLETRLVKSMDAGTTWSDIQPGGEAFFKNFGRGGIALAPEGTVMASYLDGGALIGQLPAFLAGTTQVHSSQSGSEVEPFNFVQDTDDDLDVRITGNMVGFSPYFETDHLMFGCSFYSLFASFDFGTTWHVVWKSGHTATECEVSDCMRCHVKNRQECILCRPGMYPNGITGGCEHQPPSSLLSIDSTSLPTSYRSFAAASRVYVEILSILAVVTLAAYAVLCRIWAYYACKDHRQNAESRKGANSISEALPFSAIG